jgi:cation diffusion facilitator CzcD-associated flavoprotein CzcO
MLEAAAGRQTPADGAGTVTDAIVIGAGFAGLYMLYRLRERGFTVRGFEAGGGVGGTWYWNRYPGARCDSESMYYSYSFLAGLEQEWPLLERYPGQPEILRYLEHVADRLRLREDFTFDTRITRAAYDAKANLWTVQADNGLRAHARYLVTAVGCLSAANVPQFPGADRFEGLSLHTANWPHDPVDFADKKVGVIGTGASGIQAIPVIAEQAGHLTVFQRTAQFTIPAANGPLDARFVEMWKRNYPEWRRRGRHSAGGIPYPSSISSALEVPPDERAAAFERAWEQGGFMFASGTFCDLLTSVEANECAAEFIRSKIDAIVADPSVAERLKPRSFCFGTKRLPLDTNYYQTFNRRNVVLVDLQATPIREITSRGIRTSAGEHDLDIIVYATGFDALTGPLLALGIEGRDGITLADAWADGPKTYLGLAVRCFPNLFTITGPGSPSVLSNMPVSIEQHVDWISDCLAYIREHGIDTIEANRDAVESWTDHVQEIANKTLYPTAASWYMGANIAGKPRLFLPYIGGVGNYRSKCDEVAANGYEGFEAVRSELTS